jgi:hypothetical protein
MRASSNQLNTSRSFSVRIAGSSDPQAEWRLSFSSYLQVVRYSPAFAGLIKMRSVFHTMSA